MVHLRQGQQDEIIVTLTELATISDPNYLFVFTQRTTGDKVVFIKNYSDDISNAPGRYNRFEVDTETLFANVVAGMYTYKVYQQASDSNTDESATDGLVEQGIMTLSSNETITEDTYQPTDEIVTYAG